MVYQAILWCLQHSQPCLSNHSLVLAVHLIRALCVGSMQTKPLMRPLCCRDACDRKSHDIADVQRLQEVLLRDPCSPHALF